MAYNSRQSELLGALTRLSRAGGVSVALQWVPAHVGIHGNKVADALARKGAMGNGNQDRGPTRESFPPCTGGYHCCPGWRGVAKLVGGV